jgi:hypothetical protein
MGRLAFSLLFFLVVLFGVWFQRAYMATFSAEFEAQKMSQNLLQDLIVVRPFSSETLKSGKLSSRVKADEARYFINGGIQLTGNVVYEDFEPSWALRLGLRTAKATGQMQEGRSNNFFDSQRRLAQVEIPGEVEIRLQDSDVVKTRKVDVNFIAGLLETREPVTLTGPGRNMLGQGLVYEMNTQEFRMGGQVRGTFTPPRRPATEPRK